MEILFVEDSENDVELTLGALHGIGVRDEIVIARDGAEALDYFFRRGRFADRGPRVLRFVLLDLKLPKLNGFQVLKAIKTDERFKNTPVVALTSSRESSDLAEAYRLGLNGYVVKPISFKDFVYSVGQMGRFWGFVNETESVAS